MSVHAITVHGQDRPGIIAEATGRLAGLGLNLEDSTMTLLRGQSAMMLICEGAVAAAEIEAALAPLTADGTLTVTVREVPREHAGARSREKASTSWVLTVHGGDRPGIVSRIVSEVARVGGNITDLTTRLAGNLCLLVAELDLPADVVVAEVEESIKDAAAALGVGATLRAAEPDDL